MRGHRRVLDERFGGDEKLFHGFMRSDRQCRRAILQAAGLDPGAAEIVDFRPRFYGAPDLVVTLADGRSAILELCFELSARHAFKDFSYILDPASKNFAGLIWVCDWVSASAKKLIRHYATQFGLDRRITLEILVPQAGRFDAEPPMRFAFDPLLRDLRAGAPRRSQDGVTVLEALTELYRVSDEIDTAALARLLGVTPTWVTHHAAKPREGRAPRLSCKLAPNGTRLRGNDGRFLFDLDHVSSFVSDFETLVTQLEMTASRGTLLPLVGANDPRIGTDWETLEGFRRETLTRQYSAIRNRLGQPSAFCISTAGRGYSLLWPDERRSALRPCVPRLASAASWEQLSNTLNR